MQIGLIYEYPLAKLVLIYIHAYAKFVFIRFIKIHLYSNKAYIISVLGYSLDPSKSCVHC